jgi:hypothetical protein
LRIGEILRRAKHEIPFDQQRKLLHVPNDYLHLRLNSLGGLGAIGDNVKGTNALAVQAHVLGKGLAHNGLVALGDKVTQGVGVFVAVTAGEALLLRGAATEGGLGISGVFVGASERWRTLSPSSPWGTW